MSITIKALINKHGDSNLESLYLSAKRSYYQGEPELSDAEFDELESYLDKNSRLARLVGFDDDDRNAKFNHPSSMLSLGKFQASADGTPPTAQTEAWLIKRKNSVFEATGKFDGNALNIIYRHGKLDCILSRGSGAAGRDYTDKLIANVPTTIDTDYPIVEIRGEVVIETKVFDKLYSHDKKNERNFVAGVLNRPTTEAVLAITKNFVFAAVEARAHIGKSMNYLTVEEFQGWGFNKEHKLFTYNFNHLGFANAYETMLAYRKQCPFRLDGFVIKTEVEMRNELGENKHDPNWAIAIKFPPEEATTTIIDIKWQFGRTGQLTPVAVLEPTDLDGTTVRRASVHNYGWMLKKGCLPGAIVKIAKKGDIIPQIVEIKTEATEEYVLPTECPKCKSALEIENNLHLQCSAEECGGVEYLKFVHGFHQIRVVGTAGAMIRKVYESGFEDVLDVLDRTKFTKEALTKSGILKNGKTLNTMFDQVTAFNEIELFRIIKILGFDGMGNTISKQVANKIAGIPYSFKSLERKVCNGFEEGDEKHTRVMKAIERLQSNGLTVIMPIEEVIEEGTILYEMTGSPKAFGFKTKGEFQTYIANKGYVKSKIKDADVLFTDSLEGSSSKMKHANSDSNSCKAVLYSEV
jgi:DNA ligase (NAD+)